MTRLTLALVGVALLSGPVIACDIGLTWRKRVGTTAG